jgi:hypothetical protein
MTERSRECCNSFITLDVDYAYRSAAPGLPSFYARASYQMDDLQKRPDNVDSRCFPGSCNLANLCKYQTGTIVPVV